MNAGSLCAIALFTVLLSTFGCGRHVYPEAPKELGGCVYDSQCEGARICEGGRCLSVAGDADLSSEGFGEATGLCEEGDAQACYEAGMKSLFGVGASEDRGQARAYFHKGCREGHIYACMNLGLLLEEKPTSKSEKKRCRVYDIQSYIRACEQGHAQACYNAGRLYDGKLLYKLPQDEEAARAYYQKACDAGHSAACEKLEE
ncbi:MAG: tetratricopeptide repeat protein [Polyangia bacterium]